MKGFEMTEDEIKSFVKGFPKMFDTCPSCHRGKPKSQKKCDYCQHISSLNKIDGQRRCI